MIFVIPKVFDPRKRRRTIVKRAELSVIVFMFFLFFFVRSLPNGLLAGMELPDNHFSVTELFTNDQHMFYSS